MLEKQLSKFITNSESFTEGIYDFKLKQEVKVPMVSYTNAIDFLKSINHTISNLLQPEVSYDKKLSIILSFNNDDKRLNILFDADSSSVSYVGLPHIKGTIYSKYDTTYDKLVKWLALHMVSKLDKRNIK